MLNAQIALRTADDVQTFSQRAHVGEMVGTESERPVC